MTAKEFDEKYPEGLNKVVYQFMKAAYEVITTEEYDKLINTIEDEEPIQEAEEIKRVFGGAEDFTQMHWIPIVSSSPAALLADIISFMVMQNEETVTGKDIFEE